MNSRLKRDLFLLVMLSLLLAGYSLRDKPRTSTPNIMPVFIERVIDGDTFEANGSRFRLLGVNTPEKNERFYLQSKDYLKALEGNWTIFEFFGKDRYGRNLGYLHFGDLLVNRDIVSRGLASSYYYSSDGYKDSILAAEVFARDNNLGIWEESNDLCSSCFIISEVNNGAESDDCKSGGESIKFYNNCSFSCDITGWLVKDSATHVYIFPKIIVNDRELVTLFNGKGDDDYYNKEFFFNNKPTNSCYSLWNDDGDNVFLRDENGLLVDFYRY